MNRWHNGLRFLLIVLVVIWVVPFIVVQSLSAAAPTEIKHDAPKDFIPGFRINLDAEIKDDVGILTSRCYFKAKKDKSFIFVSMLSKGGSDYQATLPAPWLNSEAIDYVFVVVNNDKKVVRTEVFTMQERETEEAASWQDLSEVKDIRVDTAQETIEEYELIRQELNSNYGDKLPAWQTAETSGQLTAMSELQQAPTHLKGYYDSLLVTEASDSAKYGLLAEGLYPESAITAAGGESVIASATGATTAGTVSAASGIGMGAIIGGAAVVSAAALGVSAGGGDDSGSSSSASSTTTSSSSDGTVTSRNVSISVIDINAVQDDYYDLYVNGSYIGAVNNPPGGTTTHSATLNGGSNLIELRLTAEQGAGTYLQISINSGEFLEFFGGTQDHSWSIDAP